MFTPINTQEELDKVLKERLEREAKKYETQITELTAKAAKADEQATTITNLQKEINENKAKIKGYETDSVKKRIAHEIGLPYEMAERLRGDDEKAIREDAEAMKKYIGKQSRVADPDFNSDRSGVDKNDKSAALKSMLSALKGD